jgi:hypothetical protein
MTLDGWLGLDMGANLLWQHHRPARIGGGIVFASGVWLGRIGAA